MDQPLRFCIVSTFYPPYNFGGDGIYAHRLANGLARLGHQVTVLHSPTAYETLAGAKPAASYDDHPNVTVRPVHTPLRKLGLLFVQQTGRAGPQAPALRQWLDRGSFDVIHYNNVSLLGGPTAFRYGSGLKLCTLIEHWLVCPMHVLWRFDKEVCEEPRCLRCTLQGRRPPQLWRYTGLMRRATRHIDAFLGPSMFTIEAHRDRGLNGMMIQLPLFHRDPDVTLNPRESINEGRPYFLFVGRLEKIKGLQTIIPVFRRSPQYDLLVTGGGTYEQELRQMAADVGNVKFLGRLDQRRIKSLYAHATATLVPSLCYETFGLIVAESWSVGTPVIVRAGSSLKELVEIHGGGMAYLTDDDLVRALHRFATDPAFRDELGLEGRAAYEAEFEEGAFLRHYEQVVRELLARKQVSAMTSARSESDSQVAGRIMVYARALTPSAKVAGR
jgi:glycosyltransferase involved in cell wall biosynthesis